MITKILNNKKGDATTLAKVVLIVTGIFLLTYVLYRVVFKMGLLK